MGLCFAEYALCPIESEPDNQFSRWVISERISEGDTKPYAHVFNNKYYTRNTVNVKVNPNEAYLLT